MDDRRRRFEAVVLPHLDAAYRLARWLSRSSSDADDIAQESNLARVSEALTPSPRVRCESVVTDDREKLPFDGS